MRNILLVLAYDGTDFLGWQRQLQGPTIQGELEAALERILGSKTKVWGSGRTDAGVHAAGQAANFKTECSIPCANLLKALNNVLPVSIRIKAAREAAPDFHARYQVCAKTYRYRILMAPVCSPFLWRFVWHYPYALDPARMAEAAKVLQGEHDFTSFAAVEKSEVGKDLYGLPQGRDQPEGAPQLERAGQGPGMVRTIFSSQILWRETISMLTYEVRGSGFLHHMVRNIVGTLVEVGRGKLTAQDVVGILAARDRTQAGPTAPAQGLCLMKVEY